jgi:ATP-dependent RNA helicase DDX52/ROK1
MGKGNKPNSIKVEGDDVSKPIHSFRQIYEKFGFPKHLQDAIKKSNYKAPTAVQAQIIPLMMDRREIICSAPTGSGKTLAFLLPIIHQLKEPKRLGSFRALILAPTRELAKQIHREALWISDGSNLRIHHLKDLKEAAKKFNPESLYKYDILVSTPSRLSSLLKTEPPAIRLNKLEWLIIDECDRVFDMGLKDDLSIIYNRCLESDQCCRAMFSATLENKLVEWAKVQMTNVVVVMVGGKNRAALNVQQSLLYVGNEDGKLIALRDIIHQGIEVPALIFVETKEKAKYLANELLYDDLNIDFIHSERDQKERDTIVSMFREGKIWFLVCTDLMGRGIDFKGVNVVINYDCPRKVVSYIHRVGRTGRAGRDGKAITFVADGDRAVLPKIVSLMRKSGYEIPKAISSLMTTKSNNKSKNKKSDRKIDRHKSRKKMIQHRSK